MGGGGVRGRSEWGVGRGGGVLRTCMAVVEADGGLGGYWLDRTLRFLCWGKGRSGAGGGGRERNEEEWGRAIDTLERTVAKLWKEGRGGRRGGGGY